MIGLPWPEITGPIAGGLVAGLSGFEHLQYRTLILGFGVLDLVSSDQGADQRAEESLASFARVMDELKEPKIEGEFLLRNAAMRPQPGAQQ
jgi:hypothetical protein